MSVRKTEQDSMYPHYIIATTVMIKPIRVLACINSQNIKSSALVKGVHDLMWKKVPTRTVIYFYCSTLHLCCTNRSYKVLVQGKKTLLRKYNFLVASSRERRKGNIRRSSKVGRLRSDEVTRNFTHMSELGSRTRICGSRSKKQGKLMAAFRDNYAERAAQRQRANCTVALLVLTWNYGRASYAQVPILTFNCVKQLRQRSYLMADDFRLHFNSAAKISTFTFNAVNLGIN